MGCSSRPDNYREELTLGEKIDYFNGYLEEWRRSMGIDEYFLAGHSLGAHLVGHYARAHPNGIKRLLILSPIGIKFYPPEQLTD